MFKVKWATALGAVAALALAGCAGNAGSAEETSSGETALTWGVVTPISTFAAQDAPWANESPYIQAVYDTLLVASPDNEIEPNIATEWAYDDSATTLTMTLRDDVTFTNGEQLTAEDAAASLLAFRDGSSADAANLQNVENAVAEDATTLVITLSEVEPALLMYLSRNAGVIAPAEFIDDPTTATEPVGSGPYVLNVGETVVGSSYAFDKNEDYWNPDRQHYDQLTILVYTDASALLNAVQGHQVNVVSALDFTAIPQMEQAGYDTHATELNWAGFLLSDRDGTQVPALAELEVRQAINYALDREALTDAIASGYGTPTAQIFPTFSTSFDEDLDSYYEYDLQKAKDLMADAGYADGFDVVMPRGVFAASVFTLIADQLAQIGITVNYDDVQLNDYIGNLLGANYAMSYFQLQQDPTDWQIAQFQVAGDATWNVFSATTPDAEALIDTMQNGSADESVEAARELNRYLVEHAWFAPIFRQTSILVTDENTDAIVQPGNPYPHVWNVTPQ